MWAAEFLQIISLNFVASGIIFTCSGMFQALGNTIPVAPQQRLTSCHVHGACALALAAVPDLLLRHLWYLSVTTVFIQMLTSWVSASSRI